MDFEKEISDFIIGLADKLAKFIIKHQEGKGYIDTQDSDNDTIYAFVYDEISGQGTEVLVNGVRHDGDGIEIVYEHISRTIDIEYSDEDFKNDDNWVPISWSDVYYRETLMNIAESIEQYV